MAYFLWGHSICGVRSGSKLLHDATSLPPSLLERYALGGFRSLLDAYWRRPRPSPTIAIYHSLSLKPQPLHCTYTNAMHGTTTPRRRIRLQTATCTVLCGNTNKWLYTSLSTTLWGIVHTRPVSHTTTEKTVKALCHPQHRWMVKASTGLQLVTQKDQSWIMFPHYLVKRKSSFLCSL